MLTNYVLLMEYQRMIDRWLLASRQNDKISMSSLHPWQSCLEAVAAGMNLFPA